MPMSVRKGAPKAVMALAHHMIVVVYQVLSRKEEYVEMGGDFYDRRDKPKVVGRLVMRLMKLGYQVDLKQLDALLASDTETPPQGQPADAAESFAPKRQRGRPCKCAERGIICKHGTTSIPN